MWKFEKDENLKRWKFEKKIQFLKFSIFQSNLFKFKQNLKIWKRWKFEKIKIWKDENLKRFENFRLFHPTNFHLFHPTNFHLFHPTQHSWRQQALAPWQPAWQESSWQRWRQTLFWRRCTGGQIPTLPWSHSSGPVSCSSEYCGKNCWWLRKKKSTLLLTPYDLGERISSVWPKFRSCKFRSKFCILQFKILRQKLLMAEKKKEYVIINPLWPK